ncbi:transcriptional regulator [Acinetobacter stercoris]|uniref:Cro/Cl family transcriptional regulator n=1 Tax=Acinetobacter stercoris TaxID=2126983 RepID=A0A2U3N3N2_9GAMM|nr:Cro/CI family transcriptional regulator [Acinetobacter stercoris]SPL72297.1 hypothetical protein KPC_3475 [Acinetobacter stercoris]
MSTPEKAFAKAVKLAGSKSALAKKLEITPWALSKWNPERIPDDRCLAIEDLTNGEVKAEELRPDINWIYVRAMKNSSSQVI